MCRACARASPSRPSPAPSVRTSPSHAPLHTPCVRAHSGAATAVPPRCARPAPPFDMLGSSTRGRESGRWMMRRLIAAALLGALAVTPLSAALSTSETRRIEDAATVLTRTARGSGPGRADGSVAEGVLRDGDSRRFKKAAFIIGGEYGKGLMSCRRNGAWSPPVFMRLGKGSWGLQFGAQTIDLVLLVMNDNGRGETAEERRVARCRSVRGCGASGPRRARGDRRPAEGRDPVLLADAGRVRRGQPLGWRASGR